MNFLLTLLLAQAVIPAAPPVTLAQGQYGSVAEAKTLYIRTVQEWETLWTSINPTQPAPAVPFATEAVAAVFLGERPSGGYRVNITGTRRDGTALVIEYTERAPGPGDIVTQALTSPFHIVRVPRHDGAVSFSRISR